MKKRKHCATGGTVKKQKLDNGDLVEGIAPPEDKLSGLAFKNADVGTGIAVGGNLAGGLVDAIEGDNKTIGGQFASGALKGAAAGAALGPWGAAAGAAIGGTAAAIKQKMAKEKLEKEKAAAELALKNANAMIMANKQSTEIKQEEQMMADGGPVKGKSNSAYKAYRDSTTLYNAANALEQEIKSGKIKDAKSADASFAKKTNNQKFDNNKFMPNDIVNLPLIDGKGERISIPKFKKPVVTIPAPEHPIFMKKAIQNMPKLKSEPITQNSGNLEKRNHSQLSTPIDKKVISERVIWLNGNAVASHLGEKQGMYKIKSFDDGSSEKIKISDNPKQDNTTIAKANDGYATGGVVKGKGGIDKVEANLPTGAFVVPVENAKHPIVKNASKMLGYGTADKTKGANPVMLTKGEVVIPPEDVAMVDKMARMNGMVKGIHALAPNAKSGTKKKVTGGDVEAPIYSQYIKGLKGDALKKAMAQYEIDNYAFKNPDAAEKEGEKFLTAQYKNHDFEKDGKFPYPVKPETQSDSEFQFPNPKFDKPEDILSVEPNDGSYTKKYSDSGSKMIQAIKTEDAKKTKTDAGTVLGIAQAGMGLAGVMNSGNNPIESGMPEYKISPVIQNDINTLAAKRDKGLDDAVRTSVMNSIEDERTTNVGLAKELSGGSNVTAFNRAILANSNATEKKTKVAAMDQEQRDKNLSASMEGNKMLSSIERTIYEDKMKKKLLDQDNWEKKQNAWGTLLNAGITNVIGASQLKKENENLKALREKVA